MQKIILTLVLSMLLNGPAEAPNLIAVPKGFASPSAEVSNNEVTFEFPETATFRATISSTSEIISIVLEYGNEQQTCGTVIAKSFPQFSPGKTVNTEWTWDMRQSGSLPPGAQLWWRWRVSDSAGIETVSETKTATWLDTLHHWQTISGGQLRLHWYGKDKGFAQEMLNAGRTGLDRNAKSAGLEPTEPIDIYVYPTYQDMQDAILYEASWTGGEAFPEQDIVIMGISGSNSDWDQNTVIHELTHVLVGHLTFSCLSEVPQWLNEGLAVYSEGRLDAASQKQLDDAIQNNTLLTIRSLSGNFSEVTDKAFLSYSESYSVTKYLIDTYGQEKMTSLLIVLRDGATIDEALSQTYGFNVEGLEELWRKAINAQPRVVAQPTLQSTPTYVPTIIPVAGMPLTDQTTPTAVPTSSLNAQPAEAPVRSGPPLSLTLVLLGLCCFFTLFIGVFILGFIVRRESKKGDNNVQ